MTQSDLVSNLNAEMRSVTKLVIKSGRSVANLISGPVTK
jgi:hypothetical protein